VLSEHRLSRTTLTQSDLRRISAALRRGVSLFVEPSRRDRAVKDLAELCGSDSIAPKATKLRVSFEADIGKARAEARRLCTVSGAQAFTVQKVATIVSELARNMVLYAGGGTVELIPTNGISNCIVVRACDSGAGISNLDEVLSGRYRSKTGLGRGLLGTKRLADRFQVKTGPAGTTVIVEIAL
jgi:serine/threonine-protein kinase RsbT